MRNILGERVLGLPKEPQVDRDVPFRELAAQLAGPVRRKATQRRPVRLLSPEGPEGRSRRPGPSNLACDSCTSGTVLGSPR